MGVQFQQFAERMADVALIQDPWIYRGQIRSITNSGETMFSVAPEGNVRSWHLCQEPYSCPTFVGVLF
jgi:hypothetical protein